MRSSSLAPPALALVLALAGCRSVPETPLGDEAAWDDASGSAEVVELVADGGRVDWGWARDRIAFDRLGADGFFDVWTMRPDGSDPRCFSCAVPGLPARNVGQPAWHPTGEWLLVQAEKAESGARPYASHPGRGARNDLWLIRADGSEAFPLTDVPNEAGAGVLHAHFHEDTLTWSQMVGGVSLDREGLFGRWELHRARLVLTPAPHLEEERATDLGREAFFESHGLTEDGRRWIFSANLDGDKGYGELNDIYSIDAESLEDLRRHTTHGYNEHAAFVPGTDRWVWMSNAGNPRGGTDWWMAGPEGAGLTRLTRLGGEGRRAVAADLSFGPEGDSFVGYVQEGVGSGVGRIVRVTLPEELLEARP